MISTSMGLNHASLNPYCSGQWSRTHDRSLDAGHCKSLNPYCSGQWSRTALALRQVSMGAAGLNPYCSGQWSRTLEKYERF